MLSVSNYAGEFVNRKRRCSEVDEGMFYFQPDTTCLSKKTRNESANSLYETCGEIIASQDESWSKENFDCGENEMVSDQEYSTTVCMTGIVDAVSPRTEMRHSFDKVTPVGHKGRSMNDYCTSLTVKKNSANLNRVVRFEEVEPSGMMVVEEPIKVDNACQSCKATASDVRHLQQCHFCCRSFCSGRCVCSCEHCGGVFCHSTCSTLNYSSVFVKTLCLDCNSDTGRSDYYQI